jgi:Porin subfamily
MFLKSGHIAFLAAVTTSLLMAVGGNIARAGESRPVPTLLPSARDWQALDKCAAYGPDFTSVAGSDTCVRIGGRVRVQFYYHKSTSETGETWTTSRSITIHSEGTALPTNELIESIEQSHLRIRSIGAVNGAEPLR